MCFLFYIEEYRYTIYNQNQPEQKKKKSICLHNKFILPAKVIDTVGHSSPLVTRA